MKLCTSQQMRALDGAAVKDYGIPSILLMENAGRATVEAVVHRFGDPAGRRVLVFAGPGNNGGDGLVIARHLHQRGARPEIILLVEPDRFRGDAAVNLAIAQKLGLPIAVKQHIDELFVPARDLHDVWLMVDSLFGTGLTREINGHFAEAVTIMNRASCPVVAVDTPSGLDSDSGRVLGACVAADLTVTYGLAKIGQVIEAGPALCGELVVADISIPPRAVAEADLVYELLDHGIGRLLPRRPTGAHKGTSGHLLVIAGSTGKTGAAMLAGLGAMRVGAGLVTMAVPAALDHVFETSLMEAMTLPLSSSDKGILSIKDYDRIVECLIGKRALVIGPGLGTAAETAELVLTLYRNVPLPMVVDADALNILAQHPEVLRHPGGEAGPRILTPHPGEMARMIDWTTREVQAERLIVAGSFATINNTVTVLKGAGTVVCHPDGRAAVNPSGNPGMASGGMGDVLSGVIGGLLAQGLAAWEAARLGVYLHGLAADRLAAQCPLGYLAGEVADELPNAMAALLK